MKSVKLRCRLIALMLVCPLVNTTGMAGGVFTTQEPVPKPEVQKILDEANAEKTYIGTIPILERALALALELKDKMGEGEACFFLGRCYDALGPVDKSIVCYEQAYRAYATVESPGSQAAALTFLGKCWERKDDIPKAKAYLEQAIPLVQKAGDKAGEIAISSLLGNYSFGLGETKRAIGYYERGLQLCRLIGQEQDITALLVNLAQCHDQLGDFKKAQSLLLEALDRSEKRKERANEAMALNSLGLLYANRSEWTPALDYYRRAITVYRELEDKHGEATVTNNLGLVLNGVGSQRDALDLYEQALKIYREIANPAGEATTLNNIGMAYSALDEQHKALEYYRQSVAIYHRIGLLAREALVRNNIGAVYSAMNQPQAAHDEFVATVALARKMNLKSLEGTALANLALEQIHLDQPEKAIETFKLALPILQETGNRGIEATAQNNLGMLYASLGKIDESIAAYKACIAICEFTGNRQTVSIAANNIGLLLASNDELLDAISWYEQSLSVARSIEYRSAEATALANLGMAKYRIGQKNQAVVFGKESVRTWQRVRESNKGFDKSWQSSFTQKVAPIYRDLADTLAELGRLAEAQQVLDLLKDDEFQSFLNQRAGAKAETVDLTQKESTWLTQYQKLGDEMAKLAAERDELMRIDPASRTDEQKKRLSELRKSADEAAAAFQNFIDKVEEAFNTAGAETDRLNDLRGSVAMQTALKQLPNRPAAIYTLITGDGVRVIASMPGLTLPRQAKAEVTAATLNRKILAFRQALADPRLDPRPVGAELYDLLIRPIEKDLRDGKVETLMWSLDGVLRYIPVWALYDRDTKQFLIEKYPSAIFTPRTIDRLTMAPRPGSAVQFGVTKKAKVNEVEFAALPGVAREMSDVHDVLGGEKPKLDSEFTYDAFREALENGPRVVHVATHFRFKPGSDKESFLLLGNGQGLSIETLKNMEDGALASVDLLVLSACETAMGGDGSEFEGFALLAQLKGAGSVIATLWPVSDESTALLMRAFYNNRKSHPEWTKLQSLRAAQLAMIRGELKDSSSYLVRANAVGSGPNDPSLPAWPKSEPSYVHPYYWAPFVLTGNWR